jgi:acyl-homoserine-lactone acylase
MMSQLNAPELRNQGRLWAEPFDPEHPLDTPSGLAPAPPDGPDPILQFLAGTVQTLQAAGLPVDVTLGDAQFALRNGTKVPIHGGNSFDGTTNVVGFGSPGSILDPAFDELDREVVAQNSQLARIGADTGYLINNGTSFLLALAFTDDGPQAKVFLNYSDTEDRSDPDYVEATARFSVKDWRTVAWTDTQIEKQQTERETVRG